MRRHSETCGPNYELNWEWKWEEEKASNKTRDHICRGPKPWASSNKKDGNPKPPSCLVGVQANPTHTYPTPSTQLRCLASLPFQASKSDCGWKQKLGLGNAITEERERRWDVNSTFPSSPSLLLPMLPSQALFLFASVPQIRQKSTVAGVLSEH